MLGQIYVIEMTELSVVCVDHWGEGNAILLQMEAFCHPYSSGKKTTHSVPLAKTDWIVKCQSIQETPSWFIMLGIGEKVYFFPEQKRYNETE